MEEFDAYKKDLVTPGVPFSHSSMKPYKVFRGGLRRKRECCFSFPGSPFTRSPLARVQFLWTHPRRPEEWRQSFSPLPTARSRVSLLLFVSFKLGIKERNWDFNVRRFLMWPLHSPGSACTPRGTEPSASLWAVWDKGRRDALHRQRRWSSGALRHTLQVRNPRTPAPTFAYCLFWFPETTLDRQILQPKYLAFRPMP